MTDGVTDVPATTTTAAAVGPATAKIYYSDKYFDEQYEYRYGTVGAGGVCRAGGGAAAPWGRGGSASPPSRG